MLDSYFNTFYLGINLASAAAAAVAGYHWLKSATLSLHGSDEGQVRAHNWVAAFAASLAAATQAMVAARAALENLVAMWR